MRVINIAPSWKLQWDISHEIVNVTKSRDDGTARATDKRGVQYHVPSEFAQEVVTAYLRNDRFVLRSPC